MARRRKGEPVHGWLAVDKPQGMTSAAVVGRLKRWTRAAKVGHAGTLDPLATGVLPLAFGEATKTVSHAQEGRKRYRFEVRFGEGRETDDSEGAVTARSDARPARPDLEAALAGFRGLIWQRPPVYSAIKSGGQRAYDLARAGSPPDLAPRQVRIDALALLAVEAPAASADRVDVAVLEAEVGKGFYVRALARDLGEALGVPAHVGTLRRLQVGAFTEDLALPLDKLEEMCEKGALVPNLLPVETALDDIPALALTGEQANRLRAGQSVRVLRTPGLPEGEGDCYAVADGKPVALAQVRAGEMHPLRVFNL